MVVVESGISRIAKVVSKIKTALVTNIGLVEHGAQNESGRSGSPQISWKPPSDGTLSQKHEKRGANSLSD